MYNGQNEYVPYKKWTKRSLNDHRMRMQYSSRKSDCHTIPDSTNGRVTDYPVSGDIHFVLSYPFARFGHVQNFKRPPRDKNVGWVNVTHALVCSLSGSCVVLVRFVRFSCVRHPVGILYVSVDVRST